MLINKIQQKLARWAKKKELDVRWRKSPQDCSVDYGWIKLPYTHDGDFQELLYHVHVQEWYRQELAAFGSYLKAGDHVVDVGGNIGFVSTILSQLVGPTGQVISFEPNPTTFRKFQRTVQLNELKNVIAHNLGCGVVATEAKLSWISDSSGHCRILAEESTDESSSRKTEAIRIIRLDDFLATYPQRLSFLKIDTEGYEPGVLAGAAGRIRQDQPVIYIELAEDFKESSAEAQKILQELGYKIPGLDNLQGISNGSNFIALPQNWAPSP